MAVAAAHVGGHSREAGTGGQEVVVSFPLLLPLTPRHCVLPPATACPPLLLLQVSELSSLLASVRASSAELALELGAQREVSTSNAAALEQVRCSCHAAATITRVWACSPLGSTCCYCHAVSVLHPTGLDMLLLPCGCYYYWGDCTYLPAHTHTGARHGCKLVIGQGRVRG